MVLSIKDNYIYTEMMKGKGAAEKAFTEGAKAGLTIAKNQNKPDRVTPAQLKLIQDSRPVQSPYQPKEAIDPLDPAKGVVDKAMITPNTILLPRFKEDGSGAPWDTPEGTPEEIEELERKGWSNLQINPDVATLLPGEKGTTGGLGTMNREALDRYIKENGISGPAAGKLIKKWQGLHGGVNLPLAHNYRQGPTGGSMYNELMIRARDLMNSPNPEYKQRGLDILKISPEVYKLEQV